MSEKKMPTKKSRRMSLANILYLGALAVVVVISAVVGRWLGVVIFGLLLVLQLGTVLYTRRRAGVGDVTRVNSLEYSDERDKTIGVYGLAAVGVVGLVGSFVWFIWAILFSPVGSGVYLAATFSVFGLNLVWAIANSVAARRL